MRYRVDGPALKSVDGKKFIWIWRPGSRSEIVYLCEADTGHTSAELEASMEFRIVGACGCDDEAMRIYDAACDIVGEGEVCGRSLVSFLRQASRCCSRLENQVKEG